MKKALLITLSIVVVSLIGLFVVALLTANSLIASFKPEIERAASDALGGTASISEIDVSVFPSTYFMLKGFVLKGPGLEVGSEVESLTLQEVRLDVRLWDLLSKKLSVSSLTVISPEIVVIRETEGIRIAGLPKARPTREGSAPTPRESNTAKVSSTEAPKSSAPIDIALEEIRVENALVRFRDEVAKNERSLDRVNLRAAISLTGRDITIPNFDLSARAEKSIELSAKGNDISLRGDVLHATNVTATLLGNQLSLSGQFNLASKSGDAKISAPGLDLASFLPLKAFAPADTQKLIEDLKLSGVVRTNAEGSFGPSQYQSSGTLTLSGVGAQVAQFLISNVNGDFTSSASAEQAEVRTSNLNLTLNGQPIAVTLRSTFSPPLVTINTLTLGMFSGNADIKGTLRLADTQPLQSSFKLAGIDVSQALLAVGQNAADQAFSATIDHIEGTAAVPLKGSLPKDVTAKASVALSKAELKGFNLAGAVLRAVKDLPFLQGALYESVPPDQRGEVDGPNTVISKLTANVSVAGASITTPDLKAQSALFNLEADGTIGFDASIDLNATLLFNPTFSQTMVTRAKGLKGLLDDQKRLVIPLTIKGTAPKLIVIPNIERLLKTGVGKALQEKASDFLGKALGGNKDGGGKKGLGGVFGF